jgi:hypothetical protein
MNASNVIPLGLGVRRLVDRELAAARARWGMRIDLLVLQQSVGKGSIPDREALPLVRRFNETGRLSADDFLHLEL